MSSENQVVDKPLNRTNRLDRFVKSKMDLLDLQSPPIPAWSKENSWQSIRRQLQSTNKNVIVWGLAMAASVSLVVAASINFTQELFQENIFEEDVASEVTQEKVIKKPFRQVIQHRPFELSKVLGVTEITQGTSTNKSPEIALVSNYTLNRDNLQSTQSELEDKNPVFAPSVGLNLNNNQGAPSIEFSLDFNVFSKTKGNLQSDVKVGISNRIQRVVDERGERFTPYVFADLGYSIKNTQTQKGWAFKTGYLLNRSNGPYQNNTFKFSVNRQFNRRIKAGPEVIFTDNFNRAYPGVTIVFS